MKTLLDHIKKREFKNVYLIYGPEAYLRLQYRDRLKNAVLGPDDTMNYNYFEGKNLDVREIISLCDTMPFFADYRVIVVENSPFFSAAGEALVEYIPQIPDTCCLIFVEESVDKRNRLFKAISQKGYAAHMGSPDEKTLKLWIGSVLKNAGKQISEATVMKFLSTVDNDMENMKQELEKLICYVGERDYVDAQDVAAICSVHIENKVFDMLSALAMKQQKKAMSYYDDLLALKEPPMRILYLMARQFNTLLQIKELSVKGYSVDHIAERTGMKAFIVRKNLGLTRQFTYDELRRAVEECADYDEAVKTGRIQDRIAVEMLMIKYSS